MKQEVLRQAITIPICWIASLLAWLFAAAAFSTPMTDSAALLFFGTAELLMFYWITFLFGLIFVRETLEAYEPRWTYILVGIFIGVAKACFYVVGFGGLINLLSILKAPLLYVFATQGVVAAVCFVVARPRRAVHGFDVVPIETQSEKTR